MGVATALRAGGPGALFWMWVSALLGMATKYAEGLLAVRFRTVDENGQIAGGPMYYIERGMGSRWIWPVSYTHLDVYKRQRQGRNYYSLRGFPGSAGTLVSGVV